VLGDERHVAQHVDDAAVAAEPGLFRSAFGPVHGRAGGWAGWPATTVTLIAMVSTWLGNVLRRVRLDRAHGWRADASAGPGGARGGRRVPCGVRLPGRAAPARPRPEHALCQV